jgi:predicted MPP superfamily phosphohydrolase
VPPVLLLGAAGASAAAVAWSLFEAQWVELRERDAPLPALPAELDGLRVLHLSDFHLGTRSLNARALEKALSWAESLELDLAAVTGDLVSRRRGEETLRRAFRRLRTRLGTFVVLGNHDVAETRDPFSRPAELGGTAPEARLLEHGSELLSVAGRGVQVAGADPRRRYDSLRRLADPRADLRILLTHFPDDVARLEPGDFHLVLAGHLHGGQICVPAPRGKIRLEHLRAPYWEGLFELPQATLHVSRGLGTSFVPFRFLARPEATVLTLRRGRDRHRTEH